MKFTKDIEIISITTVIQPRYWKVLGLGSDGMVYAWNYVSLEWEVFEKKFDPVSEFGRGGDGEPA